MLISYTDRGSFCLLINRLLIEDWEIYFLSDVDDGTTFMNQNEYINCLERMSKCKTLMLSTNNYTISWNSIWVMELLWKYTAPVRDSNPQPLWHQLA